MRRRMTRALAAPMTAAALWLASLASGGPLPPAAAQKAANLPPAVAALVPAAKREGEAVIFGITLNPSQVDAFAKAISAYYGFPIKLNMFGALHVQKTVEVVEAVRNGAPSGMDIFWTSAENIETLQRGGALARYDWIAELGLDPALKFGAYGLRAHDGMLTNVTVNTDMVKAGQAPKSYDDLLDPKWKGRMAAPRSPGPWVNLSYAIGEEKTAALLTALVKTQQLRILPRYPDVLARVVNGEFPLGIGTEAFIEIRKKAPVAHADLDIMVIAPWGFTITKDAVHPAMAKLWGYWATTREGQSALDQIRGISAVTAAGTDVARFAEGKKVFVVPYDYMVKNAERLNKQYGEILGVVR